MLHTKAMDKIAWKVCVCVCGKATEFYLIIKLTQTIIFVDDDNDDDDKMKINNIL